MTQPRSSDVVMRLRQGRAATKALRFRAGEPVKPLSIGQKGWWSIEADGVEELHAYIYFDGQSLLAKGVYLHNPPLLDGFPIRDKWTKVPWPSVLGLGSARILIDRVQQDESEIVPGTVLAAESPSEEISIAVDEDSSTAESSPAGTATRVLGSQFVEQLLKASGDMPPSPKTTVRLDIEELWFRATEPQPTPLEAGNPPTDMQDIAAASDVPPSIPRVPRPAPMRRAVAVLAALAALLLLVRVGIGPKSRSLATSLLVKKQAPPSVTAAREEPAGSAPTTLAPDIVPSPAAPTLTIASSGRTNAGRALDRTLEREAADAVARADYPLAARRYRELVAAHPDRLVFRECARILAKKTAMATE